MTDSDFNLIVLSREGVVFKGLAESITSFNEEGKFDVLAGHANFISLIQNNITIRLKSGIKEIPVDNALLRVRRNNVEIYLGILGVKTNELQLSDEIKVKTA